ncbi:Tetratricopeptide repeat and J domain-containing co-chaperone dnj1 [Conoideocrella luteorostrata]|uniref:Tetratricopeptide repeat and J domain-containing co-chaperone DNJ1 n=1 Tax=Conoideocrella luteorostrata TaxID=1105319 RepID=A0AAJ0FXV5_9HYPO|nr:Tetratricopeptide repeat and J domain-containing co-chaperone dnj1 [Conoideocrella luteorostrata]
MRLVISNLALTATLLASATTLVAHEIPVDLPVSALLISAQSHLAKGETSEALAYYDAAVAKDPSNYLTFFKRATTYLSLGRSNQASQDFGRVLELKPGFQGAHLQLAKIKSKIADWEGARAEYVLAEKDQESPDLLELGEAQGAAELAAAAEKDQKWDECISHAGIAILVASRAPSLRELRSRCRFERGEVEEGMGDLHHVLQLRPGNTDPHVLISAITFYGLADLDNGLSQIRKCLHSDPDSKVCKGLHKQQKRLQKAISKAESQLNRGQITTAGRALVGTADEPGLLANIREQIDELRETGRIPTNSRIRLYENVVEMVCQAYSESNHKDAAKYCEEAIQADAESFWGLIHRAKSLLKREEYEAAIQTLEKAAESRPDKRDKVNPILNKAQLALKRSKTKDYYKVIGVANDADERQIKSAYRKASKQYHPDKAAKQGISKEDAEKKMAAINEAYEVLSDPELRARFDQGDDPNSQERGSPFQGSPFGGGHPFMFHQQGGGGGGANFKFHFPGGGGGGPFGF